MIKNKRRFLSIVISVLCLMFCTILGFSMLSKTQTKAEDTEISSVLLKTTLKIGNITEVVDYETYFSTTGQASSTTEGVNITGIDCYYGADNAAVLMMILLRPSEGYSFSGATIVMEDVGEDITEDVRQFDSYFFEKAITYGKLSIKTGDLLISYECGYSLIYENSYIEEQYREYYNVGDIAIVKQNPGDFRSDNEREIISKWSDDIEYSAGDEIVMNEDKCLTTIWEEGATPINTLEFSSEPSDYTIIEATDDTPRSIVLDTPFALASGQDAITLKGSICLEVDGIIAFAVIRVPYGYYLSAGCEVIGMENGPLYGPIYLDECEYSCFGEMLEIAKPGDYLVGSILGFMLAYDSNIQSEYGSDYILDDYYKATDKVLVKDCLFESNDEELFFGGWNASELGTGISFYPGESFEMGMFDWTLYAIWTSEELPTSGDLSGSYYLSSDITLTSSLAIAPGDNVLINLNGHTINFGEFGYSIYNAGKLCIYDPTEDGINGVFTNTIYDEHSYFFNDVGYTEISGTVYPGQNLNIKAIPYGEGVYLASSKAYKSSDSNTVLNISDNVLQVPNYDFTFSAVFDYSTLITEIAVVTPTDYEINEDGSVTIEGEFSLDGDIEGITVVDKVEITNNGIISILAIRLQAGYCFCDINNIEITGVDFGSVNITQITKPTLVEMYKQMFGFKNIGVGDYLIACQLGYSVLYMDGESEANYIAYTYKEDEKVTIVDNIFGYEKEGYYFGGWNTRSNYKGDYYFPGEIFPMGTENLTLFPVWTNTILPTEGDLDGCYVLLEDTVLTGNINVRTNKSASINLNGHVIDFDGTESNIACNGSLYIFDSNKEVVHYYKYNKNNTWEYVKNPTDTQKEKVITYDKITSDTPSGSIIKVNGGAITNGLSGGIYVYGNLLTNGINIIGNSNQGCGGAIDFNSGFGYIVNTTILGNSASNGGGVSTCDYDNFILSNTVIKYNSANRGGGIYSKFLAPILDGKTIITDNYAITNGQNYDQEENAYFYVLDTFNGEIVFYASEFSTSFIAVADEGDNVEYFDVVNDKEGYLYKMESRYNEYYQTYEYLISRQYTITFVTYGGDVTPEPIIVSYRECIDAPAFTSNRKGFKFLGWSYTDDDYYEVDFEAGVYDDITFYAFYELDYNQPTKDNPQITFNEQPDEEIIYRWYMVTDNDYWCYLENENTNKLVGDYGVGSFVCELYIENMYYGHTDKIYYSDFSIECDYDNAEVNVTTVEGTNLLYKWYYWNVGELKKYSLYEYGTRDVYKLDYNKNTKLWTGLAINQQHYCPGFTAYYYAGEKLSITINAPGAEMFDFYIYSTNSEFDDDIEVTASENYTFTYTFKDTGNYGIEIYAYIGDYDEYIDYTASIDLIKYEWTEVEIKGETSPKLSNFDKRVGFYQCYIYVNSLPCADIEFHAYDKFNVQPTVDNDYTLDVNIDGNNIEFKWYEYEAEEYVVNPDCDLISPDYSTSEYNEETGVWSISEDDASDSNGLYKYMTLNLEKGDIIFINAKTYEDCYIRWFIWGAGFIYDSRELSSEAELSFTIPYTGECDIQLDAYTKDEINNIYFHAMDIYVVVVKATYTIVDGQTTDVFLGEKDGTYVGRAYNYNGYIQSEPFEYCNHEFENISYEWNDDNTECTVTANCSKCEYSLTRKAVITSKVTTERSVDNDEMTLFTATFENTKFKVQTKEIKTADKLQVFEIKLYTDKDGESFTLMSIVENDSFEAIYSKDTVPAKKGYMFIGWFFASDNQDTKIEKTDIVSKSLIAYALWEEIDISEFITLVDSIPSKTGEERFTAIANAINTYNSLSEEEKKEANEKYNTLVEYISSYNQSASTVNEDMSKVTRDLLLTMIASFSGILGLIYILKGKLF